MVSPERVVTPVGAFPQQEPKKEREFTRWLPERVAFEVEHDVPARWSGESSESTVRSNGSQTPCDRPSRRGRQLKGGLLVQPLERFRPNVRDVRLREEVRQVGERFDSTTAQPFDLIPPNSRNTRQVV